MKRTYNRKKVSSPKHKRTYNYQETKEALKEEAPKEKEDVDKGKSKKKKENK